MKPSISVQFWRGGRIEAEHRVMAVVVNDEGEVIESWGDEELLIYWRSSAKPFQAAAVVLSGAVDHFGITPKEIALLAGSHSGESIHTDVALGILKKLNLEIQDLQCGIQPPLDFNELIKLYQNGAQPTPLHNNCSGKHAGMLALALYRGASVKNYLDPQDLVQQEILSLISQITEIPKERIPIGIDGCSAPVFGVSLKSAAMAYARLIEGRSVNGALQVALQRVAVAMRSYPEMVAGTHNRICTQLMRWGGASDLVAKAGAEGVYGAGWRDPQSGRSLGLAVKVIDGSQRARDPVVIGILQKYKVLPYDLPRDLKAFYPEILYNWAGKEVGKVTIDL
ncbi:MAG: asparaginase [bacterium]